MYNESADHDRGFFQFINNSAKCAGQNLYGGLLDRCSINPFGKPLIKDTEGGYDSYIRYLNQGSIDLDSISLLPVRLCFCVDNQPDCNYQHSIKYVKKGELFNISLVAVDQVNHTVNATVHCSLSSPEAGLGEGQLSQVSLEECTSLNFEVFSPFEAENLTMFADGPCNRAGLSQMSIPIVFLPCSCPIGFQPLHRKVTNCVCECDYRLHGYKIFCNASSQLLIRESTYWINYVNKNDSFSGFIYYAHCPYDYCLPSSLKLSINLNVSNGADAQCAFNRSGVLCGACKPGLSLSLGSSQCLICHTKWPISMIFVILGSALAGILLVTIILILDMTVAVGTINGFVFYTNIVAANRRTYLPFASPNFCTIFVAWFNLEFGFDLCFFDGMDAYAKTWLQLTFPMYLIIIVCAIIFISNRSSRFSQLIGKKNPVATLATLILLAFTKFLQTTIVIFSFAILKYPNGSSNTLWLPDASIKYMKGQHLPLFFTALLIVIASVIFIWLLFSWQWILQASNFRILKWSKNTRLHTFIDSYLVPYTSKFRFWTGLLLFSRVVIYLVSSANMSDDPVIDLLAVSIVMTCLLLLKVLLRDKLYRKLSTELLETACYFNLLLFTIISFFSLKIPSNQRTVAQISVSIIFAAFLFVFIYHIFRTLHKINSVRHLIAAITMKVMKKDNKCGNSDLELQDAQQKCVPTATMIDMKSCLSTQDCETNKIRQCEEQVCSNQKASLEGELDCLREPLLGATA